MHEDSRLAIDEHVSPSTDSSPRLILRKMTRNELLLFSSFFCYQVLIAKAKQNPDRIPWAFNRTHVVSLYGSHMWAMLVRYSSTTCWQEIWKRRTYKGRV